MLQQKKAEQNLEKSEMNSKIKQRNKSWLLLKYLSSKKAKKFEPNESMLKADTDELNKHFNETAKR